MRARLTPRLSLWSSRRSRTPSSDGPHHVGEAGNYKLLVATDNPRGASGCSSHLTRPACPPVPLWQRKSSSRGTTTSIEASSCTQPLPRGPKHYMGFTTHIGSCGGASKTPLGEPRRGRPARRTAGQGPVVGVARDLGDDRRPGPRVVPGSGSQWPPAAGLRRPVRQSVCGTGQDVRPVGSFNEPVFRAFVRVILGAVANAFGNGPAGRRRARIPIVGLRRSSAARSASTPTTTRGAHGSPAPRRSTSRGSPAGNGSSTSTGRSPTA